MESVSKRGLERSIPVRETALYIVLLSQRVTKPSSRTRLTGQQNHGTEEEQKPGRKTKQTL